MYYLQSRYYNPEWGRFINADGITGTKGELLAHNIFLYCSNDPINKKDDTGFMACQAQDGSGNGRYDQITSNQSGSGGLNSATDSIKGIKGIVVRAKNYMKYASSRMDGLSANTGAPKSLEFISNQVGKKWGKHKTDYPDMKNYNEYKQFSKDIFDNPEKIIFDKSNSEYLYIKGENLLRVKPNGDFISTYPGASSSIVTKAINEGGIIWDQR